MLPSALSPYGTKHWCRLGPQAAPLLNSSKERSITFQPIASTELPCYSESSTYAELDMSPWKPLFEIRRGPLTERVIFGSIAWEGDSFHFSSSVPPPVLFGRSLMKPFQMKAVHTVLGPHLSWEQKALSVSSHDGRRRHMEIAKTILPTHLHTLLRNPVGAPLSGDVERHGEVSQWSQCCSGKHSAVLLACQLMHWPLESYLEVTHPYYVQLTHLLSELLGENWDMPIVQSDGCGLPTFGLSLSQLAHLFKTLARDADKDWIWEAYQRHPELIGSETRLDSRTIVCGKGAVLAKEGADGLLGLSVQSSVRQEPLGIVIKISHGYDPFSMGFVASRLLHSLGMDFPSPPCPPHQHVVFHDEHLLPPSLR